MLNGRPCFFHMLCSNIFAIASAFVPLSSLSKHGMLTRFLANQLTTIKIAFFNLHSGKPVTKSIVILIQGFCGTGKRSNVLL